MSKRGGVRSGVAARLLAVDPGARVPTTARLAADLGVGYGTVHTALRGLHADGVVRLSTHGHQGTRLLDRDVAALWRASGRGSLVGVLPLPQSREFAGLATAAATLAEKAALPLQLTFRQGARERFALLHEQRVDWVLVSGAAAQEESPRCLAVPLPPHTYYDRDSVVVVTAAGRVPDPHGRVAIDRHSYDHTALTRAEFPDAGYVTAAYWWIPDMIAHGEVDAAVWHRTSSSSLVTATGLAIHPLRGPGPAAGDARHRAAVAYRREDAATAAVLAALFDPQELADVQRRVREREIPPAF